MPASLPLRLAVGLGASLMVAVGCGGTVTNVGSILGDSGAPDAPGSTTPDGSSGGDASSDAPGDVALDADHHAETPCAAGACGTNLCGRDECGC